MPSARAVPPNLEPRVLAKAGEGLSASEIAAWLKSEHRINCSGRSVQRLLARVAAERKPVAEAVVREKLAKTIGADLDAVNDALARALNDEQRSRAASTKSKPGSAEWARCMAAASNAHRNLLRSLALRFDLSGAGNGNSTEEGVVILGPEGD
jgi:hypothetical protein